MNLSKSEMVFLNRLGMYKALIVAFIIFGCLGIAIAVYALMRSIPAARVTVFFTTPIGFALLGAVFFKLQRIIKKIKDQRVAKSTLSASEKKWTDRGSMLFQGISRVILVVGLITVVVSTYGLFFRQVSLFGKISTAFIVITSMGFSLFGWIIYMTSRILQKLNAER